MKWRDQKWWAIPAIAALFVTLVGAVFSVVYAAYYNRTHHIAEWGVMGSTLRTPVPLWFTFLLGVLAGFSSWKAFTLYKRNEYLETERKEYGIWETVAGVLKDHKARLERKIEELESKEPKLHGVWNQPTSVLALGRPGRGSDDANWRMDRPHIK